MTVVLTHNSYGKSSVRLTKVTRLPDRHELAQWTIDIELEGDFAESYTAGDNRNVVATDTMKNIVYVLARDQDLADPESFSLALGRHFLADYPQVAKCRVEVRVEPWRRILVDSSPHPHAFVSDEGGRRTCTVTVTRAERSLAAGVDALALLKTTDSAFRGFHHDAFTTLPEVDDRLFATLLKADWTYNLAASNWNRHYTQIRQTLLQTFAKHKSLSAQHTLHAMGAAVLETCPEVDEISLAMPNRHQLLVNLEPFGRDNPNCVFVATDEPFGLIEGTLRRG
ncbi:MAG TPA: urate oxidase [Gemmataceae bacterium]|jgi:urate oxidase|nr:urate oxidase [Gemmataceae bacterium]